MRIKEIIKKNTKSALQVFKDTIRLDELFSDNEAQANLLTARVMAISAILMALTILLNETGAFDLDKALVRSLGIAVILLMMILYGVCRKTEGKPKYLKMVLLPALIFCYAAIDTLLCYNVVLLMAVPAVLSIRYYNRKLTVSVSILTVLVFLGSAYFSALYGMLDLNHLTMAQGSVITVDGAFDASVAAAGYDLSRYILNTIFRNFLPRCMIFVITAIVSAEIAEKGYQMVIRQNMIAKENGRIDAELSVAREIQERALPITHELSEHPAFEIAASMNAALQVGGDFYDFLLIDETHLALVMADVSGKGVPAAMFMMVSKLLLDNSMTIGKGPGAILTEVNHQLCEKNLDDMFVTVWLGIIDLQTGIMTAANAGHEYPLICRSGGSFEIFKDKHGLVIGGMDGIRYKEYEIQLNPGDILFVYTDGIPEANNKAGEFYGMERLCRILNECGEDTMEKTLKAVKADIDDFAGEAPQFDDITMMGFRLNTCMTQNGITVIPDDASIATVQAYLEAEMDKAGVSMKDIYRVNIAVDEIYSNVVHYSHAKWAKAEIEITDKDITVRFTDNGVPFDILDHKDPNVVIKAKEREIGGLGIFMAKKLMDDITYQYQQGCNISTMQLIRNKK